MRSILSILVLSWSISGALAQSGGDSMHLSERGVVRPKASATLMTDLVAQVVEMPFHSGDRFKRGDVLVRFDCRTIDAAVNGAGAELAARRITYDANLKLKAHDAVGKNDVLISRAHADKAAADFDALKLRQDKCIIRAPFPGRVTDRLIQPFETPGPNTPLLKVLDDSALEIDVILPSRTLAWIRKDTPFRFRVDETGEVLDAVILRIGAAVDPVSQTVKITGRFAAKPERVLAGMSGTAIIKRLDTDNALRSRAPVVTSSTE